MAEITRYLPCPEVLSVRNPWHMGFGTGRFEVPLSTRWEHTYMRAGSVVQRIGYWFIAKAHHRLGSQFIETGFWIGCGHLKAPKDA